MQCPRGIHLCRDCAPRRRPQTQNHRPVHPHRRRPLHGHRQPLIPSPAPPCSPTSVPPFPLFSHENKNIKNILGGMWDASHLAMILCALRHWKRVSMPPITQYLRHPLPRANHIPPRTKTTRLTAKNPACLLYKNRK